MNEALNWIAFDSFDGPTNTPAELAAEIVGDIDVEALEIGEWTRRSLLEPAEDDFFAALPAHPWGHR